MKKQKQQSRMFWLLMWGLGLAGQLCWNMENQWFNTFVYAKIAKDSNIVTLMVITSALVTTVSTFLFGTLSDRLGTRRRFVSIGYIVWGVFTILFGMTEYLAAGSVSDGTKLFVWVAVLVVLADDFMSFFGSMANDASFSAWTNDLTTDQNRGQVGAVLGSAAIGAVVQARVVVHGDIGQAVADAMYLPAVVVLLGGLATMAFRTGEQSVSPAR